MLTEVSLRIPARATPIKRPKARRVRKKQQKKSKANEGELGKVQYKVKKGQP